MFVCPAEGRVVLNPPQASIYLSIYLYIGLISLFEGHQWPLQEHTGDLTLDSPPVYGSHSSLSCTVNASPYFRTLQLLD